MKPFYKRLTIHANMEPNYVMSVFQGDQGQRGIRGLAGPPGIAGPSGSKVGP